MATKGVTPGPGETSFWSCTVAVSHWKRYETHQHCKVAAVSFDHTGAYKGDDTASSSHHEAGRVKFGTASRDAAQKIFISMEHEKTSGGRCSPGVGSRAHCLSMCLDINNCT